MPVIIITASAEKVVDTEQEDNVMELEESSVY